MANCDANIIRFFNNDKTTIKKETAALLVTVLDIVMIVFFWLSLICIKPFIDLTEDEVVQNNLVAPDFTVMLTVPNYKDKIEDINSIHW